MKTLSPQEEASIHQNYGLKVAAAVPIGTGAMSATMLLHTDQGRFFLKRYRSASTPNLNQTTEIARLSFTHEAQNYLHEKDFPVPRLLRCNSGDSLTIVGHDSYAIFEFVEGFDFDAVRPVGALQSAGETLGRIHHELRGFSPAVDVRWEPMRDDVIGALRRRLERFRAAESNTGGYPVSGSRIAEWMGAVERLAAELPERDRGEWMIHGDYRAQNLKFDAEGKVKAILDLDTVRPADRAFDLAYALVFFPAVYQVTPLTPDQKSAFLKAYEEIFPLTTSERNSLPSHLKLAYLRGMTLWLHLHDLGGMAERVRPWIEGYLSSETIVTI